MKRSVLFSKDKPCKGKVKAPSSKSALQRIIALSWLAQGETKIVNPVLCNDVKAAIGIVKALGAQVTENLSAIYIDSRGGVEKLNKPGGAIKLFCGESGLALRMFAPIVSLNNCCFELEAAGTLNKRPALVVETLSLFGVKAADNGGFPPVSVCGLSGQLSGGFADIDCSLSSQVLSGLLLALPAAKGNSEIKVNNLKSKPYIDLTIDLIEKFGCEIINRDYNWFGINGGQKYKSPEIIEAEGDWSSASFLLVAAALSRGSVEVENLNIDSKQGDKAIIEVLSACGFKIEAAGKNTIFLSRDNSRSLLSPFEFDASDCPDLFPPLVALASGCCGVSLIHGVERLRHKETDRELALIEEFTKGGIDIKSDGKTISVFGGNGVVGRNGIFDRNDRNDRSGRDGGSGRNGVSCRNDRKGIQSFKGNSHNDHRIAMALAVAAAAGGIKVEIENAEAVEKSYPNFFNDLMNIGGQIDE